MTEHDVRRELPAILVDLGNGHVHSARITGRMNPDATVTVYASDVSCKKCKPKSYLRGAPWKDFHYAWRTIAEALAAGRALKI